MNVQSIRGKLFILLIDIFILCIYLDSMECPIPSTSQNSLYPSHVSRMYNFHGEYVSPLQMIMSNTSTATPQPTPSLHPNFSSSSSDQENNELIQDESSVIQHTIDNNNNDIGIGPFNKSIPDQYYSEDLELVRQLQEKTKSLMDATVSSRYNQTIEYQSIMYGSNTVNQQFEKQTEEQRNLYQASYSMCGFRK